GALVAWLVGPGDTIERGQIVAEVETDKGIIEVECWEDATVDELLVEAGEVRLAVGTPIARLRSADDVPTSAPAEPSAPAAVAPEPAEESPEVVPRITPPVRHLAHELGVDIDGIAATGPGGMVTRGDVKRGVAPTAPSNGRTGARVATRVKASPRARRVAAEAGVDLGLVAHSRSDGMVVAADVAPLLGDQPAPSVEPVAAAAAPVDKAQAMRIAIARSMERSKREIPHYYLGTTVDMHRAIAWLEEFNDERPIMDRVLPAALLLKAAARALVEFGDLNGHWVDGGFRPADSVHLGVAVSLRGGGLVAPAILDADSLTPSEMMEALADLVARARAGRLRGSEMTEQTATVTNLGARGVDETFPVIVPPQVAIIGFGRVADAPVVVDGQLAVRPVVHVTLAADHRVTDGHTGGLLLLAIDRLLQEPEDL
ncbi:MAG: dihydrolipoamide acetyltransferase family protein, partial [Acidimicrobiia bacterium]